MRVHLLQQLQAWKQLDAVYSGGQQEQEGEREKVIIDSEERKRERERERGNSL